MSHQLIVSINTVTIKVSFSCRLFIEYIYNNRISKTQSIKINSKQSQYQLNLDILKTDFFEPSFHYDELQDIKVTIKLLSNKGFQFNVGSFNISLADFSEQQKLVKYKISKSGEIDAECICQLKSNQFFKRKCALKIIRQQFEVSKQLFEQKNQQVYRLKLKQQSRFILPEFSVVKKQKSRTILSNTQRRRSNQYNSSNQKSENSIKDNNKNVNITPQIQRQYESRYKDFQKEIGFHSQLFQKQREIITILQDKYRAALNEQQKLKTSQHRCQIQLEQKRKRIMSLQQQKLSMMHSHFQNQRKFYQFRQSIRATFETALRDLNEIFIQKTSQRQYKQFPSKVGEQSIKNSKVDGKSPFKLFGNRQSQFTQNDLSLNYRIIEQKEKGSRVRSTKKKYFLIQFDQCLNLITFYKDKFLNKVTIKTNNISTKLAELGHSNSIFKLKLKENRQQFQNNQQALFQYLEQLEDGLEAQLQITEEKQHAILNYLSIIQHLTDKVNQYKITIKNLEELNVKLQQEKSFIKSELHQNNYFYSMRQEQLLKKIHELQQNVVLPYQNTRQITKRVYTLNVFEQEEANQRNQQRKQQSLVRQYCERMRSKEMQLLFQRKEKQKLMQQLENKQQQLRYTMLNKKKLQLAIRLKEKLSEASADNHKSFEIHSQENNTHVQEQFLKILI